MILWEEDGVLVNDIAKKLILNTNTMTPLLKRMEQQDIVKRERSKEDERKVIIKLTEKGKQLQEPASLIPAQLADKLLCNSLEMDDLMTLKSGLEELIKVLSHKR